jgi:hypothetical protein
MAEMRTDISLIKPGKNAQEEYPAHNVTSREDPSHDLTSRGRLSKRTYRLAVVSCIFFYSGVLFIYVPFVVGVIQPKELVVSAYLFGFVFFAPQIYLTVEEFVDLRGRYKSEHIERFAGLNTLESLAGNTVSLPVLVFPAAAARTDSVFGISESRERSTLSL